MNLSNMTLAELKALKKDVDKAIETFEAKQLAEARAKVQAEAQQYGYSLEEIFDFAKGKKKMPKLPPKYRHPHDSKRTWSGRGRRPDWFNAAIEEGYTEEQLKV